MKASQFYLLQGHAFGIWSAVTSSSVLGLALAVTGLLCYGIGLWSMFREE